MGTIPDAIVINASVVPATKIVTSWGVPAIVGESTYTTKDTPKVYTTIDAVKTDHGNSSAITVAATDIFAQGIRKLYAVAISAATPGTPTADEVEDALDALSTYATGRLINGVCLAGIGSDKTTLTAKLKTFADAHNVIFTVTNPNGATVSEITATLAALSSANGFFLAHADSDQAGDVAAAALGLLMSLKPWVSPYWKEIETDIDTFFTLSQGPVLEAALANFVTDLGDGVTRVSQGLTTQAAGNPKFIDITRTKYYLVAALQNAIASYRMATEKIPYTSAGLKYIEGELKAACENVKNLGAISEYTITMPKIEDIPSEDIQNRRLSEVYVWAKLAGELQEFDLNLTLEAI